MKQRFLTLFAVCAVFVLFALSVGAQTQSAPVMQSPKESKVVTLPKDEVVDNDYFAAGETVRISGTVNGDVYAAGAHVIIDGTVNGDVLAAGGTLELQGTVAQDARIAGGQVIVSGTIGRNLTVAGGSVIIVRGASLARNVVAAGGSTSISAPIPGNLTVGTGNLTLNETIGANMVAGVGQIQMLGNGAVGANATIYSDNNLTIEKSRVAGTLTSHINPKPTATPQKDVETARGIFGGLLAALQIFGFISTLIVGLLVVHFFPQCFSDTKTSIGKNPWRMLGIGFMVFIGAPIAIIIILATLVGAPIAIIAGLSYGIGLYIAPLFTAYWLGAYIMKRFEKRWSNLLVIFVGLLVYSLVQMVPLIGWFVGFVGLLVGLGALTSQNLSLYKDLREKKLL